MIISGGSCCSASAIDQRAHPADRPLLPLAGAGLRAAARSAIVLSGGGSDGSRGIRDIHEAGGLVIVPDAETRAVRGHAAGGAAVERRRLVPASPRRCRTCSMRHAARSGAPLAIDRASARRRAGARWTTSCSCCASEFGIDFTHYKPTTVTRRIERRAGADQPAATSTSYVKLLADRARRARRALPRSADRRDPLLPRPGGVRDPARQRCCPAILQRVPPDEEIRVWVRRLRHRRGGLLARDPAARAARGGAAARSTAIFATDVHRARSTSPRPALYDEDALREVTPERRERYFVKRRRRATGSSRSCGRWSCSRSTT